jgi:alpha-beta hydrolase superfamily lysophospholipase
MLGEPFETCTVDLVRDYDLALPQARLVRSLTTKNTTYVLGKGGEREGKGRGRGKGRRERKREGKRGEEVGSGEEGKKGKKGKRGRGDGERERGRGGWEAENVAIFCVLPFFKFLNFFNTFLRYALLYIPTFSDYFWQEEIATTLNEEGFNFYALEPRRYARNIKPLTPQPRPYLIRDLVEYYEEIHWALRVLREEDGMERVVLGGHGVGATTALLFAQDHPLDVDGLFLNAPLVGLSPNIPGFSKPLGWFSSADSETGTVCEAFHGSVHVDRNGSFDWDQKYKPIPGFPLYSGWVDAMTKATARLCDEKGLTLEMPTLLISSASHLPIPSPSHPFAQKCDVLQEVGLTVKVAPRWGKKVQINLIKDGLHDLFLSDLRARDEAFDSFFDFFAWIGDGSIDPPATGGLRGQVLALSATQPVEDDEGILDTMSSLVGSIGDAVEEAKGTVSGVAGGVLLDLEQGITTFVGSDDEQGGSSYAPDDTQEDEDLF